MSSQIAILMGSDSDLPVMAAAAAVCQQFSVSFEIHILSAHRTPEAMVAYARKAHRQGLRVIIAGAGGAAHLPGMVASLTPLPVIGVPIPTTHLQGVDSLHSIVQMPKGIPVATVAIGNGQNAGLLAVQILSVHDPHLQEQVIAWRTSLQEQVTAKEEKLQAIGYEEYLRQMGS